MKGVVFEAWKGGNQLKNYGESEGLSAVDLTTTCPPSAATTRTCGHGNALPAAKIASVFDRIALRTESTVPPKSSWS